MTTYGIVAIVKDEAETIERCLASVKPHIGAWTIIDTGSSDDTPARIQTALKGIPGRLLRLPFVNFGHCRSEAFAAAQGSADWLLATDADMTWEIDPDFEPDPDVDAYLLSMGSDDFGYRLPLLLNGRRAWKSVGAVHEFTVLTDGSIGRRVPTDKVRVTHHGEGRSSPAKTRWHVRLLEADLERDPDNPRTVFYLAQSHRELGHKVTARRLYQRRAAMGGFAEEAFYAAYRAALLEPDWPDRQAALLAAWDSRPHRLEPLHALVSELNSRSLHHAAYRLAIEPQPTTDILFVHRDAWTWGMDFERSIAAWWVGEPDEARRLGEALLDRTLPDHVRGAVLRNLAFTQPAAA